MKFRLYKQLPKEVDCGIGDLAVQIATLPGNNHRQADASFSLNDRCAEVLQSPEIIYINAYGIYLKGYEAAGLDKTGRPKFKYQQWFCAFEERM